MFRKLFFFVLLSILSTSAFAASTLKCRLTDNEELIKISYAELDQSGNAELQTDEYDKFFFGAVSENASVVMVWSATVSYEEGKRVNEPLEITETSSRGTEIKFSCDIID